MVVLTVRKDQRWSVKNFDWNRYCQFRYGKAGFWMRVNMGGLYRHYKIGKPSSLVFTSSCLQPHQLLYCCRSEEKFSSRVEGYVHWTIPSSRSFQMCEHNTVWHHQIEIWLCLPSRLARSSLSWDQLCYDGLRYHKLKENSIWFKEGNSKNPKYVLSYSNWPTARTSADGFLCLF